MIITMHQVNSVNTYQTRPFWAVGQEGQQGEFPYIRPSAPPRQFKFLLNKAGYTAGQSGTVGWGQNAKTARNSKIFVTDGLTQQGV